MIRQHTPGQNDIPLLIERLQQSLAECGHPRRIASDMRRMFITGAGETELPIAKKGWWVVPRTMLLLAEEQYFLSLFLCELAPDVHRPSCFVRSAVFPPSGGSGLLMKSFCLKAGLRTTETASNSSPQLRCAPALRKGTDTARAR